jgi:uncharacterized membrane protein
MKLNINCPGCGQPLVVEATAAGQPTICAHCGTAFLPPSGTPKQGLAIASLVLGILSVFCLSVLGGIPAIILGHIAYARAKKSPTQYGGGGMAIAGFVTGYVSVVILVIYLCFFVSMLHNPAFTAAIKQAREQAQQAQQQAQRRAGAADGDKDAVIQSINNLKQIGIAFRIWEGNHGDKYPFNVSQAQGGTRELCQPDGNGYEQNPAPTFKVLANALGSPKLLVCPGDPAKHPAASFASLTADNISYQLRTGPDINDQNPQAVLMVDPVNGAALFCDGSVQQGSQYKTKRY